MPAIKCANCGSEFSYDRENDFLSCPFCSSTLYSGTAAVLRHYYFSPVITEKRARSLFSETMEKLGPGKVSLSSLKPVMLPFLKDQGTPASETLPAFTPHPAFFETFPIPSGEPLFFSGSEKELGEPVRPTEESMWQVRSSGKSGVSLYHVPFYEASFGIAGNESIAYIDRVGGKVYLDSIPVSVSTVQAQRLFRYLVAYFLFFAALSILVQPAPLAFLLTILVAAPLSPYLARFILRNLG